MTQITFEGQPVPVKVPISSLTPTESIVLMAIPFNRGLTYDEIRNRLSFRIKKGELSTVDNKVRALVQKGYLRRSKGDEQPDGLTRFYKLKGGP